MCIGVCAYTVPACNTVCLYVHALSYSMSYLVVPAVSINEFKKQGSN